MSMNYADPFSVWKAFYTDIEPKVAQSMQKMLESEEYAATSGQLLNASLQVEQNFAKMIEKLLQHYKLPSIKDFARLGELLVGIEAKIDSLEERLMKYEEESVQIAQLKEQITLFSAQLETMNKNIQALDKSSPQVEEKSVPADETPSRQRRNRSVKESKEADQNS